MFKSKAIKLTRLILVFSIVLQLLSTEVMAKIKTPREPISLRQQSSDPAQYKKFLTTRNAETASMALQDLFDTNIAFEDELDACLQSAAKDQCDDYLEKLFEAPLGETSLKVVELIVNKRLNTAPRDSLKLKICSTLNMQFNFCDESSLQKPRRLNLNVAKDTSLRINGQAVAHNAKLELDPDRLYQWVLFGDSLAPLVLWMTAADFKEQSQRFVQLSEISGCSLDGVKSWFGESYVIVGCATKSLLDSNQQLLETGSQSLTGTSTQKWQVSENKLLVGLGVAVLAAIVLKDKVVTIGF